MARSVSQRSNNKLRSNNKFEQFEREARQIRVLQQSFEKHVRHAVDDAIKIGQLLRRVKKSLPYGEWLPWLRQNYSGSEDRAERFMRIAALAARFRNLRNLRMAPAAFLLLARTGVEEHVITDIIARSEAGERFTTKQISTVVRHSPLKIATPYYPGPTTQPLKYLEKLSETGSCEPEESPQSAPALFRHSLEAGAAVMRFLEAAAAVADDLPPAQELADAAKAVALTASGLHKLAALLNALATELDHG